MGTASVDPAALLVAAQRMDTAADIMLATLRTRLAGLQFDGSVAGRAHAPAGDAVRTAVDRVVADVARWASVARETGAALRTGAQVYADGELRSAAALR
jgi:hypothetical protein